MMPTDFRRELRTVLAGYPAIARPCAEPEPLGNAGGLSGALLWRFDSGLGPLVARAWPPEGPPRQGLERIHAWIRLASRVGFLSAPVPARDGRTIQDLAGRLWDLSPWLTGEPAVRGAASPARVRAGFAALAAAHQALQGEGAPALSRGLGDRLNEIEWWLSTGFSSLGVALRRLHDDLVACLAERWLDDARRAAPRWVGPLREAAGTTVLCQPCFRDVRPEHLLFTGDRVSGLIDYGAMEVDCVAADLARLLAEWLDDDHGLRAEALAAYAAVRSLDERETALVAAFETSAALLGGGRWAVWHFLERRPFHDPDAVRAGLQRGAARLARRLAAELG